MKKEELEFIVKSSQEGALRVMTEAIKEGNPIMKTMFDLGWMEMVRQCEHLYKWTIERALPKSLIYAHCPAVAVDALRFFRSGLDADAFSHSLNHTTGGDESVHMRWISFFNRARFQEEKLLNEKIDNVSALFNESTQLGADINAASAITIQGISSDNERAEHTPLSYLIALTSSVSSTVTWKSDPEQQFSVAFRMADLLLENGAKVDQRTAAALLRMIPPKDASKWLSHLIFRDACTPTSLLKVAGRIKKDQETLAMIQAMEAKHSMMSTAAAAVRVRQHLG